MKYSSPLRFALKRITALRRMSDTVEQEQQLQSSAEGQLEGSAKKQLVNKEILCKRRDFISLSFPLTSSEIGSIFFNFNKIINSDLFMKI